MPSNMLKRNQQNMDMMTRNKTPTAFRNQVARLPLGRKGCNSEEVSRESEAIEPFLMCQPGGGASDQKPQQKKSLYGTQNNFTQIINNFHNPNPCGPSQLGSMQDLKLARAGSGDGLGKGTGLALAGSAEHGSENAASMASLPKGPSGEDLRDATDLQNLVKPQQALFPQKPRVVIGAHGAPRVLQVQKPQVSTAGA